MSDDERRALGLLGLGAKAGRIAIGVEAAHSALRAGKAEAIVMPADASPRSKEQLVALAGHKKVPLFTFSQAEKLGAALGRPAVHGVAVLDRQLAKGLKSYAVAHELKEKAAG
ncbi:MAG TPA: ribosomal L7Ae/L30e/S12e/Gadd45 family protein [Gemmatimonadales bacterium]